MIIAVVKEKSCFTNIDYISAINIVLNHFDLIKYVPLKIFNYLKKFFDLRGVYDNTGGSIFIIRSPNKLFNI